MNSKSPKATVQVRHLHCTGRMDESKTLSDLTCNKLGWKEPPIPSLTLKLIRSGLALELGISTLWLTLIKALTAQH